MDLVSVLRLIGKEPVTAVGCAALYCVYYTVSALYCVNC